MARSRRLKPEHKIAIVKRLARWETPSQVAQFVRDEFGIEITRQSVQHYDPTTDAGKDLAPELAQLFHETRKQFIEQVDAIPVTHQAYRLQRIQNMLDRIGDRNPKLAMSLLRQAAEEIGGALTNQREVTVLGKIAQEVLTLPDEELWKLIGVTDAPREPAADPGGDPATVCAGGGEA